MRGDRAARRELLVAGKPALDDRDLLVELALPLAHVGDIDRLHRRRDIGEHVALLHRVPSRGKPPGGGDRRPPTAACTKPLALGSGMIRPGNSTERRCDAISLVAVRNPKMRWMGFGTNTEPSPARRARSAKVCTCGALCPSCANALLIVEMAAINSKLAVTATRRRNDIAAMPSRNSKPMPKPVAG